MKDPIFGQQIKQLRIKKNLTQQQIANDLRLTPQFIMNWERGASLPPPKYWNYLCKIFGKDFVNNLNQHYKRMVESKIK